jgi:lysine biosynthesis protein LysW
LASLRGAEVAIIGGSPATKENVMAPCPECDAELQIDGDDLEEMDIGDPWNCPECGSHLRVVNMEPLEFESDDELDDDEGKADDPDDDSDDDGDDDENGAWDE